MGHFFSHNLHNRFDNASAAQLGIAPGHSHLCTLTRRRASKSPFQMARRSARLVSKPVTKFSEPETEVAAEEDTEFDQLYVSDSDHEEPVRKKRKKSSRAGAQTTHVKGRRGRLRQLPYVL